MTSSIVNCVEALEAMFHAYLENMGIHVQALNITLLHNSML